MRRSRDAYERIGGAHARRERLAIGICLKTLAQEARIALVNLDKAGDRRSRIGESFGRDARRGSDAWCGMHVGQAGFWR